MKRVKRAAAAVAATTVIVLVALTFTNYAPAYLVRVDGQSMEPTLRNGDYLLVVRGKLAPGKIIVARVPDGTLVKRAHWSGAEAGQRPRFLALGDNTWNSEGRYVFLDQVLGVVVLRLWPCNQQWREAKVPLRVYSPQQYQERLREVTEELIRKEEAACGKDQHNRGESVERNGQVPEPQARPR